MEKSSVFRIFVRYKSNKKTGLLTTEVTRMRRSIFKQEFGKGYFY